MDDTQFGTRSKRGDWSPDARLEVAPFWTGQWGRMGRFLLGFLWPWNAFHLAVTALYMGVLLPDWEVMKTLSWGWVLYLYAVNAAGILLLYGGIELVYYTCRKQGTRFKYNHRFPSESPSDVFWFRSQNLDNVLRTFFVSVPVVILWAYANSWASWLRWDEHWLWLVALMLWAPFWHEIHFFAIHRLIHTPFLYKWVHSVHHNSINPSPWSSLSMHPVEGFIYHAVALWHLLIPSNPFCAVFQLNLAAYGAINGHIGFDRLELTDTVPLESHAYAHYLHHKYFEVNYGGDGLVPLDQWFGSWHDGSKEADEAMKARFRKKKERAAARRSAREAER